MLLLLLLLVMGWTVLNFSTRNRYKSFLRKHRGEVTLSFLASGSLLIVEYIPWQRFHYPQMIHLKMIQIYGPKNANNYKKLFLAETLSLLMAILTIFIFLLYATAGDRLVPIAGGILFLAVPWLKNRELNQKIRDRQRRIQMELPEVINKLLLLVNAGESLPNALARCVKEDANSPLQIVLNEAIHELANHRPFQEVMENVNKKCSVQEVSMFTTTLLLHNKRGGDELVAALNGLSMELWERRKGLAKILGEEASSKMVFPMVLIFLTVMLIIASPVLLTL